MSFAYIELAQAIGARKRCESSNNTEWLVKHSERIEFIMKNHAPSGGGFDSGTTIDLDKSTEEKLVFHTSYHHMAESGMYDGWTEHTLTVVPSFIGGYSIRRITGRNRNSIKEYMAMTFDHFLTTDIPR